MAVKIRLARTGAKKIPLYRIVAADSRAPRDGRFIEILGRYNPRSKPSSIELDVERTQAWIDKGAQMSPTVAKLFDIAKNPDAEAPVKEPKPSKKSRAKASEESAVATEPSGAEVSAENDTEPPVPEETAEASAAEATEADPEQ